MPDQDNHMPCMQNVAWIGLLFFVKAKNMYIKNANCDFSYFYTYFLDKHNLQIRTRNKVMITSVDLFIFIH